MRRLVFLSFYFLSCYISFHFLPSLISFHFLSFFISFYFLLKFQGPTHLHRKFKDHLAYHLYTSISVIEKIDYLFVVFKTSISYLKRLCSYYNILKPKSGHFTVQACFDRKVQYGLLPVHRIVLILDMKLFMKFVCSFDALKNVLTQMES